MAMVKNHSIRPWTQMLIRITTNIQSPYMFGQVYSFLNISAKSAGNFLCNLADKPTDR